MFLDIRLSYSTG